MALEHGARHDSAEEAVAYAELPGVAQVFPDEIHEMETDVSNELISSPSIWQGATGTGLATQGEGVVVGMKGQEGDFGWVNKLTINEGELESRDAPEPGDYLTGDSRMVDADDEETEFYNIPGAVANWRVTRHPPLVFPHVRPLKKRRRPLQTGPHAVGRRDLDVLELDDHRLACAELQAEDAAEVEVALLLVDQLSALNAVDFEDDLLALGGDAVVVPLAGRPQGRHLAERGGRAFARRVDDRLLAVGREEFGALAVVQLVADTSEVAAAV